MKKQLFPKTKGRHRRRSAFDEALSESMRLIEQWDQEAYKRLISMGAQR